MKRLLACLICLALVLNMTAVLAEQGGEDEVVTITFYGEAMDAPGLQSGPVLDVIEEKLGIRVEYIVQDADRTAVWRAAGELPDIMYLFYDKHEDYRKKGDVLPLNALIEEYGQDIEKNAPDMLAYSRAYKSGGTGECYFLISKVLGANSQTPVQVKPAGQGISIRWDYYSEIGCPPVTNEDELFDVVAQILEKHPTTADGLKTYGFSGFADWALWSYAVPYGLMHGQVNQSQTYYVDGEGNPQHVAENANTNFFNGLRFYNKAYRKGLIDPEMFTQTNQNYSDKQNNLQLITSVNMPSDNVFTTAGIENGGYFFIPGAFPYVLGDALPKTTGDVVRAIAITKNCKNPEKAMQLINFMYSTEGARLVRSGVEGVHWAYDENGVPGFTEEYMNGLATVEKYDFKEGINRCGALMDGLNGNTLADDGYPVDLHLAKDYVLRNMSTHDANFAAQFGCEYPFEVYTKLAEDGKGDIFRYDLGFTGLFEQTPKDVAQIDTLIKDKLMVYIPKIVLSETDEEREQMIQEAIDVCNDLGMQESLAFWYNQFDTARAAYYNK